MSLTAYIIGSWTLLVGCGFLSLIVINLELPSYQEEILIPTTNINETKPKESNPWVDRSLLFCGILFVFFLVGIDITFQSQIYIFGLCGPLKLSAQHAGWLNSVYFVSLLIGRIVAIPLSIIISPTVIILCASLGCLVFAIILVSLGAHDVIALFIATAFIGFHVCFFLGSIINWLTSQIKNMTSKHVSIIFLGGPLANSMIPPLASKLFYSKGPIFVFYTTILCDILLIVCFVIMNIIAKWKRWK